VMLTMICAGDTSTITGIKLFIHMHPYRTHVDLILSPAVTLPAPRTL
jgi:hypothetical protein